MALVPSGCFGMKTHIGVDAQSGLVHTVITTAANVSDVTQTHALLHGEEATVYGDAGYQGVEKREENQHSDVTWQIALPFPLVKNLFGFKKARYRGLAKNAAQLFALFGLANLLTAKRRLFALHAQGTS